jgi:hypothetical protein
MKRTNTDTTHFLNVDLDIYSKSNLQPLVTAMGKQVHVLFLGRIKRTHQAHLELWKSGLHESADSIVRGFCVLIQKLPKSGVELWNGAKVRDFNVGVQAAMQPHSHEIALAAETVRAAAEVNARIVLTVYAPERGES